jgi:hypothetical protein
MSQENVELSSMTVLRRSLPFVAILVAMLAFVSDWPLGWSGWVEHPLVAAFVAGLVLLLLTGSVVDVILQRREARRWVDLGRGAAYALDQVFYLSGIAMFQLVGVGRDTRLSPEIEFHVAPARKRARELLGRDSGTPDINVLVDYDDEERAVAVHDDRLPTLLPDGPWREHVVLALLAFARVQEATIARWISAFGALGDAQGFRRVSRSIAILDRAEVLVQQLLTVAEVEAGSARSHLTAEQAARTVTRYWKELVRAYSQETQYWENRHAGASGLDLSEYPITQRRVRSRSGTTGPE